MGATAGSGQLGTAAPWRSTLRQYWPILSRRRKIRQVIVYALKKVIQVLRVQIPAGDIAPARSTGERFRR